VTTRQPARPATAGWPVYERSILGSVLGLPGYAAIGIALGFTGLGVFIDLNRINGLGAIFKGCYFAGCVLAVCWVKRRALFGPMVQPPLLLAIAVPAVVLASGDGGTGTAGLTDHLLSIGAPLLNGFPTMAVTTAFAVAIGVCRYVLQRPIGIEPVRSSSRPPSGRPPSERPSRSRPVGERGPGARGSGARSSGERGDLSARAPSERAAERRAARGAGRGAARNAEPGSPGDRKPAADRASGDGAPRERKPPADRKPAADRKPPAERKPGDRRPPPDRLPPDRRPPSDRRSPAERMPPDRVPPERRGRAPRSEPPAGADRHPPPERRPSERPPARGSRPT
jgi:hypothetical protein